MVDEKGQGGCVMFARNVHELGYEIILRFACAAAGGPPTRYEDGTGGGWRFTAFSSLPPSLPPLSRPTTQTPWRIGHCMVEGRTAWHLAFHGMGRRRHGMDMALGAWMGMVPAGIQQSQGGGNPSSSTTRTYPGSGARDGCISVVSCWLLHSIRLGRHGAANTTPFFLATTPVNEMFVPPPVPSGFFLECCLLRCDGC